MKPRRSGLFSRVLWALLALALMSGCSDGYVGLIPGDAGARDGGTDAAVSQPAINGAVYFPASAYNVDQTWLEYDPAITERDFGYAARVHLNALRVFGSHQAYAQDVNSYQSKVEDLLTRAAAHELRVLFVLFEGAGDKANARMRALKDPLRAVAIQSPAADLTADASQWQPMREHVAWFMTHFKDDPRLLAIELVNEPAAMGPFAHAMLSEAVARRGSVPLTVGTSSGAEMAEYADEGVDVLQFHNDFPATLADSQKLIDARIAQAEKLGRPVWLTEWQRLRPSGANWSGAYASPAVERYSDLAPMAQQVRGYGVKLGSFFWSLMVKPGYLSGQRRAGTINGLFWEDGAVWDLASARVIAGEPELNLTERKRVPFEQIALRSESAGGLLVCTGKSDGTGKGSNVLARAGSSVASESTWQLVRIDHEPYFRLESVACQQWLQCSSESDVSAGKPDASADQKVLAVRAVASSDTSDETRWRWIDSGTDLQFFLQNKASGYYLEVSALPDVDQGEMLTFQVRAVPSTKTGPSTRFRSLSAAETP